MKKFLMFLFMAFMVCFIQNQTQAQAVMPDHKIVTFTPDTVATGADSIVYFTYADGMMKEAVNYQLSFIADSVDSDTTINAAAILQWQPISTAEWISLTGKSLSITGTQASVVWEGTLQGGRFRVKSVNYLGSPTIRIRAWVMLNTVK